MREMACAELISTHSAMSAIAETEALRHVLVCASLDISELPHSLKRLIDLRDSGPCLSTYQYSCLVSSFLWICLAGLPVLREKCLADLNRIIRRQLFSSVGMKCYAMIVLPRR
jgi:hypothetical protein